MSEAETKAAPVTTFASLSISDALALLEQVLTRVEKAKEAGTLGDMKPDEFVELLVSASRNQQLAQASAEMEVTRRIFLDARALALGQPFRIGSQADLDKFYKTHAEAFKKGTYRGKQLVVALALQDRDSEVYAIMNGFRGDEA